MQEICTKYAINMQLICMNMHKYVGICRKYAKNMQRICKEYAKNMQRICKEYARICHKYAKICNCEICRNMQKYAENMQ